MPSSDWRGLSGGQVRLAGDCFGRRFTRAQSFLFSSCWVGHLTVCVKRWEFFDLRNSGLGVALVCSTASTVAELCSDIQEVMDAGILGSKRMQFAESQLFVRTGRHWMKVLSAFAEGHKEKLGTKDLFFFNLFKQLLQNNIPREIRALN